VIDLYARHIGAPILVVGGGPSAPKQLSNLELEFNVASMVTISANSHAFKLDLSVDYIVCKDHEHTETKQPMQGMLSQYHRAIVARHHWADYRMQRWPTQGNSGMLAIALAALMGGRPIIPIGIDGFQAGTYFHDLDSKNVSSGRREGHWKSRFERLALRLKGAVIRSPGGFLDNIFRPYDRREALPAAEVPEIFRTYRETRPCYVRTIKAFTTPQDRQVLVPADYVLASDVVEAAQLERLGVAVKL
jgi:hypothetical protein